MISLPSSNLDELLPVGDSDSLAFPPNCVPGAKYAPGSVDEWIAATSAPPVVVAAGVDWGEAFSCITLVSFLSMPGGLLELRLLLAESTCDPASVFSFTVLHQEFIEAANVAVRKVGAG